MADDIDLDGLGSDSGNTNSSSGDRPLIRDVIEFCGGPDIIEVFGGSGSGKSTFARKVIESAVNDAGKDGLFIDTENNVGDLDDSDGFDYVYVPDWHDIYAYVTGKESLLSEDPFGDNTTGSNTLPHGYDVVVLDSIGFPALIQFGEYRIADDADQFKVFNELQVITGTLKKYAQRNDTLVIVTNQPKSELSGDADPDPFGDKAIFGFKEVWSTVKESSNPTGTTCKINAFRSRQAGAGKVLFELKINDNGVTVKDLTDDEAEADQWV